RYPFLLPGFVPYVFLRVGCGGAGAPNRLLWRRLFESFGKTQDRLREFLSHRIRAGDGGTPESLRLCAGSEGPRTGRNGFGYFCRNKSSSSAGTNPFY
ncbi:MAG: hypothetical protein O3A59_03980, partial [Nitrospirae bacterium]|nr:hypothetical protein [Nitrospirota bacterium]